MQQNPPVPYYSRYDQSIRVVTTFFAAVLGFGLKHMLDTAKTVNAEALYTYKWQFFVVTVLIFLRFLTGPANHLWLQYVKFQTYYRYPNFLVATDLLWLTVFACFGVAICYMNTPDGFFWRTFLLLAAAVASMIWDSALRIFGLRKPVGQWAGFWIALNVVQILILIVLWQVPFGGTIGLGGRLSLLAAASFVLLAVDFRWQLKQLAEGAPPRPPH
jgi:hypothetical protein